MSMNLHLDTVIDGLEVEMFLYQTPTEISFEAIHSGEPLEVYKKWIKGNVSEEEYVNQCYHIHIKQLEGWMELCEELGYIVNWYYM